MSIDAKRPAKAKSGLWDSAKVIVQALALALAVRVVLIQPFNIPSGSMIPTLLVGDYLFVSKYSYGYSKHSLPFSPDIFSGRILGRPPQRGDVAVFKLPRDNDTDFIKRIVGLPGDKIQMINGVLQINGVAVKKERHGEAVIDGRPNTLWRETLPNGVSFDTLDLIDGSEADNTQIFNVPAGHYFAMGDNRDNSTDSRFFGFRGVGFVPEENLVGRAEILFFSIDESASLFAPWRWPTEIRWSRLLNLVR